MIVGCGETLVQKHARGILILETEVLTRREVLSKRLCRRAEGRRTQNVGCCRAARRRKCRHVVAIVEHPVIPRFIEVRGVLAKLIESVLRMVAWTMRMRCSIRSSVRNSWNGELPVDRLRKIGQLVNDLGVAEQAQVEKQKILWRAPDARIVARAEHHRNRNALLAVRLAVHPGQFADAITYRRPRSSRRSSRTGRACPASWRRSPSRANLELDRLPRRPEGFAVERRRKYLNGSFSAAEQHIVLFFEVVQSIDDNQRSDGGKAGEIAGIDFFDRGTVEPPLQELAFRQLEQMRLVVAQVGSR